MPLLAVVGSADPIKAGVDAFKQLKPELTVIVIDGATHSGARGAPGRPEFAAGSRFPRRAPFNIGLLTPALRE